LVVSRASLPAAKNEQHLHTQAEQGFAETVSCLGQLSIGDTRMLAVNSDFTRSTFREVMVEKGGDEIKFLRHDGR
jgi:hypothetical protein